MARGFSSAPGASAELVEVSASELEKSRMLVFETSKNGLVRTAIAERSACPFGLMVTLAHDHSVDVRSAVAANPGAQRSVLQYLSTDRAVPVILALIENPSLPEDVLKDLAFHKKAEVRDAATRRLDTGIPGVTESHLEDEHTPEIADHASLSLDVDWGLESDMWSASAEDARVPLAAETVLTPLVEDVAVTPANALRVVQFFSPATQHDGAVATRTAPVRGLRAPER